MFVSKITATGLQVMPLDSQPRLVTYVGLVTERNHETFRIRYSTSVPQDYLQFVKHPSQIMSCPETHVFRHATPHVIQARGKPREVFARGQAYQFHTCLRWLSEAVGPLPRRAFLQISPGDCPWKVATPYRIGIRRTMCQPRLFGLNIAKVVADAADASYSSRRASSPHWILHTSEVGYFQAKDEVQESVEFVLLQVANVLLFEVIPWESIPREDCYAFGNSGFMAFKG